MYGELDCVRICWLRDAVIRLLLHFFVVVVVFMHFPLPLLPFIEYFFEFVLRKFQVLLFAVADCFEKLSLDVILKDV